MKLNLSFWTKATRRQKRIYSIVAVFVVATLTMAIGLLIPHSPQDAAQLTEEFNQTLGQNATSPLFIFQNNFTITLLMFVPLIGPALGLFILFESGLVGGAIAVAQGLPSFAGLLIIATPIFWLEFAAYSIAMAEGVWLFRRVMQAYAVKEPALRWAILKHELKWTAIFVGICAGLLAVGAVVEVWIITALT